MTRLWNDPVEFADEMIEGFVAAHSRTVRRVPGGVIRSTGVPDGQVAVVIGGGSGHYPAFGGLVGAGLAHGAALGNLFASPSAQQVHSLARAAHAGAGVLLAYGNYAGDVLNFDSAQERLIAEGIEVRTVTVTDDVMSAPADERHRRRGIAGDLVVFRAAAAAAEAGWDLDRVAAVARRANERTRSFGVAFSGCTLPGADQPLFTVPAGRMAVGLGIHGEPGIDETDIPSADGVAELLVAALLDPAERPDGVGDLRGARVVPVLNGLGSLKHEEMFVVYRRIDRLLSEAGVVVVDPHVGEFCTSFDMAGTSLTLYWLDDELETLWNEPVDAPAYRRGEVVTAQPTPAAFSVDAAERVEMAIPESDDASRSLARRALDCLRAAATVVAANAEELGRLDAVAGDGDHGIGMTRGSAAAVDAAAVAAEAGAGAETMLNRAADAWADRAGGTSGALWGVILRAVSEAMADTGVPNGERIAGGITAAAEAVMRRGGAALGDKTLVDALLPFARAFDEQIDASAPVGAAWTSAAAVATAAAQDTAALLPRMGRARSHGEHAVGSPDPGAVSFALIVTEIGSVMRAADSPTPREDAS